MKVYPLIDGVHAYL